MVQAHGSAMDVDEIGWKSVWMHLKMEEKLDEWMVGWRREGKNREKRKREYFLSASGDDGLL